MSACYRAVDWNPQKRRYDGIMAAMLAGCLTTFSGVTLWRNPNVTVETLILRATAVGALVLLQVILCIGPLARMDPRFLPWLYNRRHLGVTMFLLAFFHAVLAMVQFHAGGDANPWVSVFTAYGGAVSVHRGGNLLGQIPFEPFGVAAGMILLVMAATSHDFWLKNLGPSFWKTLHLGVYLAYGLILAHVALGALQSERSLVLAGFLGLGFAVVASLHLAAAIQESARDHQGERVEQAGFVDVCDAKEIREGRGKVVIAAGERRAVFRHENRIYATSNVCRHQGGPIGEGRIVEGCITCPWHGWNYRPSDGCSPPPFQEVLSTYAVRIKDGRVWISIDPLPLGTFSPGTEISHHGG